jgi:hypothetical protein
MGLQPLKDPSETRQSMDYPVDLLLLQPPKDPSETILIEDVYLDWQQLQPPNGPSETNGVNSIFNQRDTSTTRRSRLRHLTR